MFSLSKIAQFIALFRAMNHSCIWLDLILIKIALSPIQLAGICALCMFSSAPS